MMRFALAAVMTLHGLIHLMGFVKGLGLAEISELQAPIGPREGLVWLAGASAFVLAAAMLFWAPRYWWLPAALGLLLSQALIAGAWQDARWGTVANVIILVPVVLAAADLRPSSLRSRYERAVEAELARVDPGPPVVTEDDLARLPDAVASYLRRVGVVGRPRVRAFQVRFQAAIRGGPEERWMRGTAEQHSSLGPVARLFFMQASRSGVPVDVFHRYVGAEATMEARVLGLVPVMNASGPDLTRSETVTVLNDMFLLAPAALVDAPIEWEAVGEGRVRATFTNAGHTVSAVVTFDKSGDLVDFESGDRDRFEEGRYEPSRWSTPVLEYGEFDGLRLVREAEARWTDAAGDRWTYARFVVETVTLNP